MIEELRRKSIHFSGLILPLVYYLFMDRSTMLLIVGVLTGIALVIELAKAVSVRFRTFFSQLFTPFLRQHERKGAMTGATYYLISTLLCILFFDKTLAVVCLFFMVLGDMVAALVGKMWGRTKLIGNKSLEGSAACFVVCTAIALIEFDPIISITGALVATVVELLPLQIDDNLTVPLISGGVMHLIIKFLAVG